MSLVSIDWRPEPTALRSFGRTVIIGMTLIAAVLAWWVGKREAGIVALCVGLVIGGAGLTGTRLALPGYWLWMGVAFVMGNITSAVLMGTLYFLVVTPMALLVTLSGRDRLRLKRRATASHWVDLPAPPAVAAEYERQF
jgi:hypothetical protein